MIIFRHSTPAYSTSLARVSIEKSSGIAGVGFYRLIAVPDG